MHANVLLNVVVSWSVLGPLAFQAPPTAPVQPATPEVVTTEYDMRRLAQTRDMAEGRGETPGKKLFISRCALCHDPRGQSATSTATIGPWLDAAAVEARGEDATRAYVLTGTARMPGFRYQLDAARVDQIIVYLKTVAPDARPGGSADAEPREPRQQAQDP